MRNELLAIFCLVCLSASAQDLPKVDIFGGYSFLSVGEKDLSSRQSLNGWEASASGNLTKWFAIEGDISGHTKLSPLTASVPRSATTHLREAPASTSSLSSLMC